MPLTFGDYQIPGINRAPAVGAPELEAIRTKFFGVAGESEILGAIGGRTLEYFYYFSKSDWEQEDLVTNLATLKTYVGTNATLTESGSVSETFADVTFDGFERVGPQLPDTAGTFLGGWWIPLVLRFRQLTV